MSTDTDSGGDTVIVTLSLTPGLSVADITSGLTLLSTTVGVCGFLPLPSSLPIIEG